MRRGKDIPGVAKLVNAPRTRTKRSCGGFSPSSSVALQVFALALQQPCPDLLAGIMVSTRIMDELGRPDREIGVDKLVVALDEARPLMILRHGHRSGTQFLDGVIRGVGLALQYAGVGVVRLLDLPDDNGFQLASRGLEIKVRLGQSQ